MNLSNNDNCIVNVDELGKNPNEDKKLMHLLKLQSYRKNIIPVEEFKEKYEVLFQKDTSVDVETLREISKDYMLRIDPYNPVYVVKNMDSPTVEELLSEDNVLLTLPAIYNRLGTVNNLKEVGLEKMLAFNNLVAMDITDPFDKKKIRYSQELATVINAMTDPEELARNKEKAQEMAKKALVPKEQVRHDSGDEIPEDILKEYEDLSQESSDTSTSSSGETEEFL